MSSYYKLSGADIFYGNRDITCEVMVLVINISSFYIYTMHWILRNIYASRKKKDASNKETVKREKGTNKCLNKKYKKEKKTKKG
jgi:hypothetical protein